MKPNMNRYWADQKRGDILWAGNHGGFILVDVDADKGLIWLESPNRDCPILCFRTTLGVQRTIISASYCEDRFHNMADTIAQREWLPDAGDFDRVKEMIIADKIRAALSTAKPGTHDIKRLIDTAIIESGAGMSDQLRAELVRDLTSMPGPLVSVTDGVHTWVFEEVDG